MWDYGKKFVWTVVQVVNLLDLRMTTPLEAITDTIFGH